jgi:hypothetical protein
MGDRLGTLGAVGSQFSSFFGFNFKRIVCFLHIVQLFSKVHMLCEGHKILQNLHQLFVRCTASQKLGEISPDFVAFSEYMNFNRDSFVIGLKSRGSSLTQEKTGSLD